ncbi:MAG: hypothetical protein NTV93_03730 [Verrucomicrobia bacterium]|nr:hypothetical protein [Verrucomicrobiota bacterium]
MASDDHIPIPRTWCDAVSKILRSGDRQLIDTTGQSDLDWEATFPDDAWDYVRFGAMSAALEKPDVIGKHILGMDEPGETYAFWFHHRAVQLYGKINLFPDGKIILIYSSHTPRKGKESL